MIERAIDLLQQVKQQKGILLTDHLYRYVTACADRLYCISTRGVVPIDNEEQLTTLGYLSRSEEFNDAQVPKIISSPYGLHPCTPCRFSIV
jgi:ABC-type Mn2+/Zn2+ transport system ATPase subunit